MHVQTENAVKHTYQPYGNAIKFRVDWQICEEIKSWFESYVGWIILVHKLQRILGISKLW